MGKDEVFGRAAQLSYYFLLSLFPMLLLLTAILGYLASTGEEVRQALFAFFLKLMPGSASELVSRTVQEITAGAGKLKLSIGVLATLWSATNGTRAIMDGLNAAYEVKEGRAWWKAWLTSIWLTVALAVAGILALTLLLYGGRMAGYIANRFGFGDLFQFAWNAIQWPFIVVCVMGGFALVYRFAPDLGYHKWKWILPGAVVGTLLWLGVSFGFKFYLAHFDSYNRTYGSLGAVIILLLWLYLAGAALLIGGEINSEVEYAAARAGNPEAKLPGEKMPGERRHA